MSLQYNFKKINHLLENLFIIINIIIDLLDWWVSFDVPARLQSTLLMLLNWVGNGTMKLCPFPPISNVNKEGNDKHYWSFEIFPRWHNWQSDRGQVEPLCWPEYELTEPTWYSCIKRALQISFLHCWSLLQSHISSLSNLMWIFNVSFKTLCF